MPAVGVTSLMPTGTPASGASVSPRATAASTVRAAARAGSAASVTNALTGAFARSIAGEMRVEDLDGARALRADELRELARGQPVQARGHQKRWRYFVTSTRSGSVPIRVE
jgi:hypothetical protein